MNDSSLMNVKITVVDHIVCGGEVVNLIYISRSEPDFNFTFHFLRRKKLKDLFFHFQFHFSLLEKKKTKRFIFSLPIFTLGGHC